MPKHVVPNYRLVEYRDSRQEWRWRLVGRNGKHLAHGGEGCKSRARNRRMARKIVGHLLNAA